MTARQANAVDTLIADRRAIVDLLRFAQWSLLDNAQAIDASRVIIGQPLPIPCNAVTVLRERASLAADIIERLSA